MKTSLTSLQTALYSALSNHAPLATKITGVFDNVPKETLAPYVVIGNPTVIDWGGSAFKGEEITFTLHVWSEKQDKSEVYEIFNLILEAFTNPLSLDGGFFMNFQRREYMEVFDDPDGISRHGIIRFRFRISQ